jgi:hypothetical protein
MWFAHCVNQEGEAAKEESSANEKSFESEDAARVELTWRKKTYHKSKPSAAYAHDANGPKPFDATWHLVRLGLRVSFFS